MLRSTKTYPLLTEMQVQSPVVESFKKLRTNLRFAQEEGDIRSILITSSREGEGKSLIAANLATAYMQDRKRVLIVDADLRRSVMHHVFSQPNQPGLTDVLLGKCSVMDAVRTVIPPGLCLLPSGTATQIPTELLSSPGMALVMQELRARFDVILIDSPPTLQVTDALVLSSLADGVLLVIQSGAVKSRAIKRVKGDLDFAGARLLGVVLNRVGRSNDAYQYYYG